MLELVWGRVHPAGYVAGFHQRPGLRQFEHAVSGIHHAVRKPRYGGDYVRFEYGDDEYWTGCG